MAGGITWRRLCSLFILRHYSSFEAYGNTTTCLYIWPWLRQADTRRVQSAVNDDTLLGASVHRFPFSVAGILDIINIYVGYCRVNKRYFPLAVGT
jgi:hypothetical protein